MDNHPSDNHLNFKTVRNYCLFLNKFFLCICQFMLFLNLILAQSVLIGLVPNRASKYGFEWTDGSLVEDGYMNWEIDEPSVQGNEQCVVITDNTKRWRDDPCTSPKHYACQRSSG